MSRSGPSGPRRLLSLASLRPLRRREFALVWSAALVSNIGSWLQTVAVGVLVTALTGQARWTGLVAAAAFVPIGVLSPVGGAIADRVDRRRLLLGTTVGETAFATLLAVLVGTGHATPIGVTLIVFGGGCMTALGFPAYQAILPDLVDREDLLGASSLSMVQFNLGRVVGPALAGVVLVAGSYTWAFALNAVSYGAVLVALLIVRLPPPAPSDEPPGLRARIAAGIRGARAEPGCRTAILTIALTALLLSPFIALIPAVALKLFRQKESGTSLLITAQGVGAVVGALALASLARRHGRRRVLVVALVVLPVLLLAYAGAPSLPLAALALGAVGALYVTVLSGLGTVVQLRAPAALRARILSLYMVALGTVYPLGAVVQGALGDHLGLRAVTAACAALFLVLVVVAGLTRPQLARTFDDPVGQEPVVDVAAGLVDTLDPRPSVR
ncbi:MAG: MFS transporter [Actinomycetota bacterium]|nr:MFS transporter [Actinomycetota bacterium]